MCAASGFPYRRINVVGTSASGKTTFARTLAAALAIRHVELDALYWERGWTGAPDELMRERVQREAAADAWVIDGNYSVVRDLIWDRADAIVWLDFTLPAILWRYTTRTARRLRTQEELWPGTGNRESLRKSFLQRDGLLWWILGTYRRRRRDYPRLLAANPRLAVIRLRSPRAASIWLASLTPR
jgi:adenylate kinase family enzyme